MALYLFDDPDSVRHYLSGDQVRHPGLSPLLRVRQSGRQAEVYPLCTWGAPRFSACQKGMHGLARCLARSQAPIMAPAPLTEIQVVMPASRC